MVLLQTYKIMQRHFQRQLKLLLVVLLACAIPSISGAQAVQNQEATSNGAGIVQGGNYTGYFSAGQMSSYLYSNGSIVATSGIILNEMSSDVEFTFDLNGNLTQNENLKSGQIEVKTEAVALQGTPLAFVDVFLVDTETEEVFSSTQTDENGYYEIPGVPYRNFFFTINTPEVPPEPVLLTFESNIFIEEVIVNAELGTGGSLNTSVEVTPKNSCDPSSPDYKIWYLDFDNDGYGTSNNFVGQCTQPVGYVDNDLDCDDYNSSINPDAVDVPGSGIDANCDGIIPCTDLTVLDFDAPTDPVNIVNLVSISATVVGENFESIIWDWGDGTVTDGDYQDGMITGSHMYALAGVYTVNLMLANSCGETNIYSHKYVVVFDPSEGFVTGSGLIYSPEGASTMFPYSSGIASFGFVSKYDNKKGIPKGNTEFEFETGDLEFLSTEYEWLVIAGAKAKFKGYGTVNGVTGYQFMISAIDGDKKKSDDPDKFRIKIWQENTEIVIYDNEQGNEIDSDPENPILEGSIIVHKPNEKSSLISDFGATYQENLIKIYPNPTNGELTVSFDNQDNKEYMVIVRNSIGQILYNNHTTGENQVFIDLSGNAAGVYYLEVTSDDFERITEKIILTKE